MERPDTAADGRSAAAVFEGHRAGERGLRRASLAVFLAGIAVFATLYAPQALLPELTRAFDVSPAAATLSISVATAGLALGLLVLGPLSDRRGRTSIIHTCLAVSAVLAVALAVVPSWEVLVVLRALQGVALAGLPAVGVAYLGEELHLSVRSRAIGLYVGGTAIGGLTGRLLTGLLVDLDGWRTAFAGVAILAVGCALAVRLLLPKSRRFVPVAPGSSPVRRLRAAMSDPVLLAAYGVATLLMGSFVALYNAGTFRLEGPYGLPPSLASLVFLSYLLGSVSSPVAGALAERSDRWVVITVSVLLLGAGLALTLAGPLPVFVAGLAVATVGFFAAHAVANGWVAAHAVAAGRPVGQAASLYSFWYYVGASVGGTVSGRLWETGGWPAVTVLTGGMAAGALLLVLLAGRRR